MSSKSSSQPFTKSAGAGSFESWARLLDSQFRIPGTTIRFGVDPILSLIPGLGDLTSPVFTVLLLARAIGRGVPKIVMMRMAMNAAIDALLGAVPVLGNIGDIFWRANTRNLTLLERYGRHVGPPRAPSTGDYAFVFGIIALLAAAIVVPVIVAIWLIQMLAQRLAG